MIFAMLVASTAHAGDLCAPNAKHHGAPIDLDLAHADLRDVLRLIADTANINLIVGDDVDGKVTLKLVHVAWEAALCSIAAVHHLDVTIEDRILMVRQRR